MCKQSSIIGGNSFLNNSIFFAKITSFESTCIKEVASNVLPVWNNLFMGKFMWLKCLFHLLLAVSISFENYRAVHPAYRDDDEDDEEVDQDEVENRKSAWGTSVFILFLSSYQSILHIIFLFLVWITSLRVCQLIIWWGNYFF